MSLTAAALHRQARRLVQRDHVVVLPDHAIADHRRILAHPAIPGLRGGGPRARAAAGCACSAPPPPGRGLDPGAIHAHSPLRHIFSIRPCDRCGNRRLSQRSSRWSPSPAATVSVCTPLTPRPPARATGPATARPPTARPTARHKAPADPDRPRSHSVTVSSEKAENVVNPPSSPVATKGTDASARAAPPPPRRRPISSDPSTFAASIASGNSVGPVSRSTPMPAQIAQRCADGAADGDKGQGRDHARSVAPDPRESTVSGRAPGSAAQLCEIVEPLLQVAFEAAFDRLVEVRAPCRRGK
jgi:hypothetical protein